MKCYETTTASKTSVLDTQAGATLSFSVLGNPNNLYHPGYLDVYMCKVSDATAESAGSGACWFKIYELAPIWQGTSTGFKFPSQNMASITATIPKDTPAGWCPVIFVYHLAA